MLWSLLTLAFGGTLATGTEAWEAGDLPRALVEWGEALIDARTTGDEPLQGELLLRLGALHRRLGRLESATLALESARKLPIPEARIELEVAALAMAAGDLAGAESAYQTAFSRAKAAADPQLAATAAFNLGVARRLGGAEDAERALIGAETLYGTLGDDAGAAASLLERARSAWDLGDRKAATTLSVQAHERALTAGDHRLSAEIAWQRGIWFAARGDSPAALAAWSAGLNVARAHQDARAQGRIHAAKSAMFAVAGDPRAVEESTLAEQAFLAARDSMAALEVRVTRAMWGDERSVLPATVELDRPDLEARLLLNLAGRGEPIDTARLRKAVKRADSRELRWRWAYVEGKALLAEGKTRAGISRLEDAVSELERTRAALADPEVAHQYVIGHATVYEALIDAHMADGAAELAFVYAARLQATETQPPEHPALSALSTQTDWVEHQLATATTNEQRAAMATELASLRIAFASRVDHLRATEPDFASQTAIAPEDLQAMAADLPPGTTLLQAVPLADRIVLLVVRREGLQARTVPVGREQLEAEVGKLTRSLTARHVRDPAWTQRQADTLGEWLLAPIRDELEGTTVLVTSTTGVLRGLPFGILREDGAWLVERMATARITHVGSLVRAPERLSLAGSGVLLVGNPDGTLPGAEAEVRELAQQLPGAAVLIGGQGTPQAVRQGAAGRQVVHLATHGRIDRRQPAASHLVLAGPDGRLPYREIPGWTDALSDTRMVVLSACQSGVAVVAGSAETEEGDVAVSINGLASQFRRAGVETLVASLWPVDDQATRTLMSALYTELSTGADLASSLRRAQLSVLAADPTAHPWYWGAFVVVGDWR